MVNFVNLLDDSCFMRAKLIVVEGQDRTGKLTQTKMLVTWLRSIGYSVATAEVPIKDNLTYNVIYWMLANGTAVKYPTLFQCVQFLNKKFFQAFSLRWMMKTHDYVVLDRWSLSSVVYGLSSGLNKKFCEKLYDKLTKPDFTIVLNGDARSSEVEDVYEANIEFQAIVRDKYKAWLLSQPESKAALLSNSGTRSEVHERVRNILSLFVV